MLRTEFLDNIGTDGQYGGGTVDMGANESQTAKGMLKITPPTP